MGGGLWKNPPPFFDLKLIPSEGVNMKPLAFLYLLIAVFVSVFPVHAQSMPAFDPVECPMPIPDGVTVICGEYQVPENRDSPNGRMIRMSFAILKSLDPNPMPDPVVFVSSGGPGGSSFDALASYVNSTYLQERDFIFVEQRGNKYAAPALDCPEVQMAMFANFSTVDSSEVEIAREVDAARQCRDRLLAQGIDLTAYNSAESAADLEDLRQLLGYEKWNLVGASYSARLVLTAMRLYPEGIRSVVLDSIYDPAVNAYEQRVPTLARALDTLFANCAADVECGTAYPKLENHFYGVVEKMNEEPVSVKVSHPITAKMVTLKLTGDDLVLGIFNALYQRNNIRFLPFIIEEMVRGNMDVIEPVAQEGFENIFSRSQGMYYSAECREEFPFNDPAKQKEIAGKYPALASFLPSISEPAICKMWGAGVADSIEGQPVISDIPALVLAGEYDPVTSPEFTQAAADNLSHSYFYRLPYFGHAVQDQSNCANQLAASFMQDPNHEPDTTCLQNLSRIDFITPENDILPTQLVYWMNNAILQGRSPLAVVVMVLCFFIFLIQILVGGIKSHVSSIVSSFATLISLLNFAAFFWFYRIVTTTDVTLLGFGLPAFASALIGLWSVIGALTICMLVLQLIKRRWNILPAMVTFSSLVLQVLVVVVK
jgi:pimeloyl-ACP methyl ester carboxylesterase